MAQTGAQPVLRELAKYPSLDPRAVLAIASHEGLGGGIGDSGTSFGPFQLHQGGALPSGIPLQAAQQWAWSPQGIDYALSRIAQVAGGLRGVPAITAISTRFERPANPSAEIADAAAHYGAPLPAQLSAPRPAAAPPSPVAGGLSGQNPAQSRLLALLAQAISQGNGLMSSAPASIAPDLSGLLLR